MNLIHTQENGIRVTAGNLLGGQPSRSRPKIGAMPSLRPAVSAILPYKEGMALNPLTLCHGDELVMITGGGGREYSIGYARIIGAEIASHNWLLFLDGDATYPRDYVVQVKKQIQRGVTTFGTRRRGGLGHLFWKVREHGLVTERRFFLARTQEFKRSHIAGRADIGPYFQDLPIVEIDHYHGFTKLEKKIVGSIGSILAAGVLAGVRRW